MLAFLARRLLLAVPLLLFVSAIAYALVYVLPGDATLTILGAEAPRELREDLRVRLGLDRPLLSQYAGWLGSLLQGDLGRSLVDNAPINLILRQRFPATLQLMIMTLVFSLAVGLPLGILAARNQGGIADQATSFVALLGLSIPHFWLGLLLIILAVNHFRDLPISGYVPFFRDPLESLRYMILPVLATSLREVGVLARFMRSSMLDVARADYVRTARAKGLGVPAVVWGHMLRNALIPVLTVAGLQVASLLSGLVITETIFVIPGVGRLIMDAILSRDTPVLLATIMVVAFLVVVVNLIIDVLYTLIDPRIKLDSGGTR